MEEKDNLKVPRQSCPKMTAGGYPGSPLRQGGGIDLPVFPVTGFDEDFEIPEFVEKHL